MRLISRNSHTTSSQAQSSATSGRSEQSISRLLADIARFDPVFIKSTVRSTIIVPDTAHNAVDDIEVDDSESEIAATITLSNDTSDLNDIAPTLISAAFQLLGPVRVRPARDLMDLLDRLFRDGLPHKVSVARPYQDSADLAPQ